MSVARGRSWLYVPGNRPDRFDRACAAGADAVIVDLEDAVPAAEKPAAREAVAAWLSLAHPVLVRVNGADTEWFERDLAACDAPGVAGIVLQFPFYGGILEVMKLTGLSSNIAHVFVHASSAKTLPFFTFLASILTKSFVPSGAGEWAVEGPVMLQAAKELGVSYGKITMAVAYGNMLGNMYQPFWSLPLLGLMGLRARDIMGFCLVLFVVCLPVLGLALLL